jgi:hypothetical protein
MRATILWAVSLFCVHVLLVTTPVLLFNATGETQGWLAFFADFPLIAAMLGVERASWRDATGDRGRRWRRRIGEQLHQYWRGWRWPHR